MGYDKPNYTQIPNKLLDNMFEIESDSELRVIFAIARKTLGWHKKSDKISLSQLEEMTGLTRPSVIDGIKSAIERGVIERVHSGQGYIYKLIIHEETSKDTLLADIQTSKKSLPVDVETSKAALPELVKNLYQSDEKLVKILYPQKKETTKESKKKTARASEPEPVPAINSQESDFRILATEPPPQPIPSSQPFTPILEDLPSRAQALAALRAATPRSAFSTVAEAPTGFLVDAGTGKTPYWILREFTKRSMTEHQRETVNETVTDAALWREVCRRWAEEYGDEWRKFGHLDWYRQPEKHGFVRINGGWGRKEQAPNGRVSASSFPPVATEPVSVQNIVLPEGW